MPVWSSQRPPSQIVFFPILFSLIFILQFPAVTAVFGQDSFLENQMSTFNQSLVALIDPPATPPEPTVRSEVPFFGGEPMREGTILDEEAVFTGNNPGPDFSGSGSVVEEEGIPLLAETVVAGDFEAQPQKALEVLVVAEAEPEPEVLDEDPFIDPFEESTGPHVSEELRDPWESFNSSMFDFNYKLDRYVMKPVAKGYNFFIPPDVQNSLGNAFSNLAFAPRFLNNVFQGKFAGAGIETKRFLINTIMGLGGFFDVAKYVFDIEAPAIEDVGQTLAVRGVGAGPYLILPFFPPTTVRDFTGFIGDSFLNPVNYVIPIIPNLGANVGKRVNERSINLETFEGIEESTVDLYGAVRAAYFDRRERQIQE